MMKNILLIYTGGTIGMIKKNNTLSPFNFHKLTFLLGSKLNQ